MPEDDGGAASDGGALSDGGLDDDAGVELDAGLPPPQQDAGPDLEAGPPPPADGGQSNPPVRDGVWVEAVGGPTTGFTTNDSINNAGDELFVVALVTSPYAPASLVSGFGVAWSKQRTQCSSRNTTGIELWTTQNPQGNGPISVSFTYETDDAALLAARYVNLRPTAAGLSASANSSGPAGGCTSSNPSLDEASYELSLGPVGVGDLVFGAVATSGASHAAGLGFVEIDEVAFGDLGLAAQEATIPQSPTVIGGSFSAPADWAAAVIELRGP